MDLLLLEPLDGQSYLKQSYGSNYNVGDGRCCDFVDQKLVESQSSYYIEDYGNRDFYFDYTHDMIEEDALNEKSCMQVMKVMIDKADEEIIELEEDIVMLQCQLAWDDDDWSNPCSIVMKERIKHLDFSIQILKSEFTKESHDFGVKREEHEILHQKLHDLLKPRLETYFLAKSKKVLNTVPGSVNCVDTKLGKEQLANSLVPVCAVTAVGLGRKKRVSNTANLNTKVEAKKRVNLKEKTMPAGLNEKKTINSKKKSTSKKTPIKKSPAKKSQKQKENRSMKSDGHSRKPTQTVSHPLNCMEIDEKKQTNVKNSSDPIAKGEVPAKDTNKLNKQVGRRLPKSFLLKPLKTSSIKPEEPSTKLLPQKSLVKKRKGTNLPESTETLETTNNNSISLGQKRSRASKPKKKIESKLQIQQIKEAEPEKTNSDSLGHKDTLTSNSEKKIENTFMQSKLHDVGIVFMKQDKKNDSVTQEPEKTFQQTPVVSENTCFEIVNKQEKVCF